MLGRHGCQNSMTKGAQMVSLVKPIGFIFLLSSLLLGTACGSVTELSNNPPTTNPTNNNVPNGSQNFSNCMVFPADNSWNQNISTAPLHPNSANYIAHILAEGNANLHADFGSNPEYGIPFIVVDGTQELIPVHFLDFVDESDPGPYPIPPNAPNEGGGDRHVLAFDQDQCMLYELYHAEYTSGAWEADSGAVFDLSSNELRPDGWTSADAAGLPIFPGLVKYQEAVEDKKILHAIRFTVSATQKAHIAPATHHASNITNPNAPPMGLRLRLKADFDISNYHGAARVILEALKTYGLILADNGSDWYLSGARDSRWDDEDLNQLKTVPGSAFEAVDTGELIY